MKQLSVKNKAISLILATTFLFSGCVSTTMIQSTPSGARVYINEEAVGTTPYMHSDTKIVGSRSTVRLEKEGYLPVETTISRDEKLDAGALIGGLIVTIPFLWILEYKPTHKYEMKPCTVNDDTANHSETENNNPN